MSGQSRIPIPSFHPFASIHKRVERHIVPPRRWKPFRVGTFGTVLGGAFLAWFVTSFHKPYPASMSPEWKEVEAVLDAERLHNPISQHVVGQPVVIPDAYYEHVRAASEHYESNTEVVAIVSAKLTDEDIKLRQERIEKMKEQMTKK